MTNFKLKPNYYFGKGAIEGLAIELSSLKIKKVMLAYGGGSIKRNGVYDDIMNICKKAKISVIEFGGIAPNPRCEHTYQGAQLAQKENVDAIIAAGGGSVIDAVKVMSTLSTNPQYKSTWDYVINPRNRTQPARNVFAVLTTSATGSENNGGSVISNELTNEKTAVSDSTAIPTITIEDPVYTYTINKWQTACGAFDILSHNLEQYYGKDSFLWTEEYIFANIKVVLKSSVNALTNPKDYDARANLMWTSSFSLNGLASFNSGSDWKVHLLEHAMSGLFDITHGAGLALITPNYIEYMCKHDAHFKQQTERLALSLYNDKSITNFLKELRKFIESIGLPTKYSDFDSIKKIDDQVINKLVELALVNQTVDKESKAILKDIYLSIPR